MTAAKTIGALVMGMALLTGAQGAMAAEEVLNKVNINAEAEKSVPRDQLWANLTVHGRGSNRQNVNSEVTKKLNKLFEVAKKHPKIEVSLSSRRTWPQYKSDSKRLVVDNWVDEAEVSAKSKDFKDMYKFMSEVQSEAAISSMGFSVSDDAKEKMEKELLAQAIENFDEKAKLISKEFGGNGYKIIRVNINTRSFSTRAQGGGGMMLMKSASVDSNAAPAMEVESGNEKVKLNMNGTVQIQK